MSITKSFSRVIGAAIEPKLTLTVFTDGRAILAIDQELTPEKVAQLREMWQRFVEREPEVLIFNGEVRCVDVRLVDADLVIE